MSLYTEISDHVGAHLPDPSSGLLHPDTSQSDIVKRLISKWLATFAGPNCKWVINNSTPEATLSLTQWKRVSEQLHSGASRNAIVEEMLNPTGVSTSTSLVSEVSDVITID